MAISAGRDRADVEADRRVHALQALGAACLRLEQCVVDPRDLGAAADQAEIFAGRAPPARASHRGRACGRG